ncbi:hypothetical protein EMIHUDRAFT_223308 [Emiliania huxleyi CCMP1516]|uniref:23S rRNA (guanine(745)-N(1))-methyltransferase N-terminal domain-containing protein n=2 Tax=Emiliania huxleyi TaxID=2903 RepID=A0A0D3KVJ6_EMIH1|nr:hypothetical protein EMIHUDRAFT_223308 [Emiliania huxleyi CCMP1516]EOD39781.1 hypothetical protein EMIHUDRAFT_223308 [Emiliania huxleyi CCMP1516]|eukprot:XP_005792210.1 hypothetical protein EMIHUDRAFT_223308 [Emiliania huxleyi CCMP1516]
MALVAAALARLPASAAALSLPAASAARAPVAYRCPSCGDPLLPTSSGSLRCRNGHSVDAAREGHHHLLRRPLSAKVAEEADQVARAARAFHDGGSFDAAADAIAAEAAAKRQPSARFAVASPHALPFSDGCFDLAAALGLRRRSLRA